MPAQITAIVPTFNRADLIQETVEAIAAQSRPVSQVIIWNDGSTDATPDVLSKLEQSINLPLDIHHAGNGGKSQALNRALAKAKGEYIWICDDDDIALPKAAETLGKMLDDNPDKGLSAGRHLRFSTDPRTGERITSDTGYWPDLASGSVLRHTLEDIFFFQNATFVRRGIFERVGPFREDLKRSIDYEMFVRLLCRSAVELTDEVVFLQRKHDGARGPASARHAAAKSETVWRAADQQIFRDLRGQIPLSVYEALFEGDDPALIRRAALLQRGCVYARKSDWQTAIDDFGLAVAALPNVGLTQLEADICRRAMSGKHGASEAFLSHNRTGIIRLAAKGRAGSDLASALARGAVWRMREAAKKRDISEMIRISRFIAARLPFGDAKQAPKLTENATLQAEAYAW
ncbi:MAG: glycosyltransferase family 2 protein [Pseudomonadota bacterium]